MNTARYRIVAVAMALMFVIASLLTGCSLFTPLKSESSKALLSQLPTELPQHAAQAVTLLVLPPQATPVFDTTQIAYKTSPYQIDYFNKEQWAATPPQMLLPLLTITLEQSGYFNTIATPPYFGSYDYALGSKIIAFTQDFTTQPATLQLAIRVELSSGATGQVISSRVIELREPIQQNNAADGVVAANYVVAQALREIADFAVTGVEKNRR